MTRVAWIAVVVSTLSIAAPASAAQRSWVGGSGNWSDLSHWKDGLKPGTTDEAYLGPTDDGHTVTLDVPATVARVTGARTFEIKQPLTITGTAETTDLFNAVVTGAGAVAFTGPGTYQGAV